MLLPPMKIEQAADHRASRALLAHIRANFESIPDFCDKTGLDRLKTQKAVRGAFQQMDAKFAFDCEKATKGAVQASWWTKPGPGNAKPKGTGTEG